MNYLVFSLFDEKTRLFGNLLMFTTYEEAERYFAFLVTEDKNRLVCKDLVLFEVGTFNNSTGVLVPTDVKPKLYKSALEYIGGDR